MEVLNTTKSKKSLNYSAFLQVSLILLCFTAGTFSQQTCSRANCASCGTVGPCSQCSKGYTLKNGGCSATTINRDDQSDVDMFTLILGIIGGIILLALITWISSCCIKKNKEQQYLKRVAHSTHNSTNLSTKNHQPAMKPAQYYNDRVL